MSRSFCWAENKEFTDWLYKEFAYAEVKELEDEVISLMYLAWIAGYEFGTSNSL